MDFESDNENRACQSRKRSTDQISSNTKLTVSPPQQSHVISLENFQASQIDDSHSKNGHYELVTIGKVPSETSLKVNSVVNCKLMNKTNSQWHSNLEKSNELKATSMTNINNNNDGSIGNQQLGSNLLRTRTHTKSLSTRISSLKRESKTTRTLSIVMFRSVLCSKLM